MKRPKPRTAPRRLPESIRARLMVRVYPCRLSQLDPGDVLSEFTDFVVAQLRPFCANLGIDLERTHDVSEGRVAGAVHQMVAYVVSGEVPDEAFLPRALQLPAQLAELQRVALPLDRWPPRVHLFVTALEARLQLHMRKTLTFSQCVALSERAPRNVLRWQARLRREGLRCTHARTVVWLKRCGVQGL